jgi:hypothetical protein
MHPIAAIFFIAFGVFLFSVALWHELTWWKRRRWICGRGTIVGFSESYNDGVSYHPEIEFAGTSGNVRVVSNYGSGKKPEIGKVVDIIINESGDAAEKVGISNRVLFTVIPILFGIVFILVGANVQPLEPTEQVKDDQLPARAESKAK